MPGGQQADEAPELLVAQQPPTGRRAGPDQLDRVAGAGRALGDLGQRLKRRRVKRLTGRNRQICLRSHTP